MYMMIKKIDNINNNVHTPRPALVKPCIAGAMDIHMTTTNYTQFRCNLSRRNKCRP